MNKEERLISLLEEVHKKLLLHPDVGTIWMDTGSFFYSVFYAFEKRIAEELELIENNYRL